MNTEPNYEIKEGLIKEVITPMLRTGYDTALLDIEKFIVEAKDPYHEDFHEEICDEIKRLRVTKRDIIYDIINSHAQTWFSAKEKKPPMNKTVFVFVPEEDNHVTTGMWDVSEKWVLLDEYRVPRSEVTYWRPFDFELPKDKSYTPTAHSEEEDTITYQMRELNLKIHHFENAQAKIKKEIEKLAGSRSQNEMAVRRGMVLALQYLEAK